jgi:dienelactone hydrolase
MVDERTIQVVTTSAALEGTLTIPRNATGVVLFAHGSGSSRFSPRNRYVAQVLHRAGLATLLIDLLTPDEEQVDLRTRHLRFDIDLLAQRLVGTIDWIAHDSATQDLSLGLFGASTGAAAALVAAAQRPDAVHAVVSRGGRPDLANAALSYVHAPTLLLVGGHDDLVLELNELAQQRMQFADPALVVQLEVVPGATHLFEEPGTLEQVAVLARDWFVRYLTPTPMTSGSPHSQQ